MDYIIEDRHLAAQTRYQLRLFLRKLAAKQPDAMLLAQAEAAAEPLFALLRGVVEDDVHPD